MIYPLLLKGCHDKKHAQNMSYKNIINYYVVKFSPIPVLGFGRLVIKNLTGK